MMLADYGVKKRTEGITIEEYMNKQKENGKIDEVTNNEDGTITIEINGYEITIADDEETIISVEKTGGVRPDFEIKITKIDGTIMSQEDGSEKAITVNIKSIEEYGNNYTIEVKGPNGEVIEKEERVVGDLVGQASYLATESGKYTITVKGIKDGIERKKVIIENINVVKVYASLNGNTLRFYNNAINARANADSEAHYYGNLREITFASNNTPWYGEANKITTVEFAEEIEPFSIAFYFSGLTNLDVSNFDTRNVINMVNMFRSVPTTVKITTNEKTKTWLNKNFPTYINITVV